MESVERSSMSWQQFRTPPKGSKDRFTKLFVSDFHWKCYKRLKSIHLIGWDQFRQWKVTDRTLHETLPDYLSLVPFYMYISMQVLVKLNFLCSTHKCVKLFTSSYENKLFENKCILNLQITKQQLYINQQK